MFKRSFTGEAIACPTCHHDEYDVVGTFGRKLDCFTSVICTHCGLVYRNPMPTEAEIKAYYSDVFRENLQGSNEPSKKEIVLEQWNAGYVHKSIESLLQPSDSILDIGCGAGEFLLHMKQLGYQTKGIEPTTGFANYAIDKSQLDIINDIYENIDFDGQQFNVITMHHMLEHIAFPRKLLQFCHACLVDEGSIYVSVPNDLTANSNPFSRLQEAHLINFNDVSLEYTLALEGFKLVKRISPTTVLAQKSSSPVELTSDAVLQANYEQSKAVFSLPTSVAYFLRPSNTVIKPFCKLWRSIHKRYLAFSLQA